MRKREGTREGRMEGHPSKPPCRAWLACRGGLGDVVVMYTEAGRFIKEDTSH